MNRKITFFFAIPFLVFALSCRKPEPTQKTARPTGDPAASKTQTSAETRETSPDRDMPVSVPVRESSGSNNAPTNYKALPSALSLTLFPGSVPVQAEDFKIGPLAPQHRQTPGSALSVAEAFIAGTMKGAPDASLLSKEDGDFIMKRLSGRKTDSQSITRWRISKPEPFEQGRTGIYLRVFGPAGSAEGGMTLVRENDAWKIDSFDIDLDALSPVATDGAERFEPQVYRVFTF